MPIINPQDAQELDGHLQRFYDANPAERPHRLRQLFTEKFDFNPATGKVSLAKAPQNVTLPSDADRIASIEGINVVYVPLQIPGTTRVRKAEVVAAAKLVANQLGDDMLLLMTNEQVGDVASQLHVILPTFVGSTPALRRMVIERDLPRRTALQQLSNIYHEWQKKRDLRVALEEAFNVEAVTRAFFEQYREVFEHFQGLVKGFPDTEDGREAKKLFVQTLFNRLMFIYFLSRKGWLKFKGDPDYLAALWKDYQENKDRVGFYEARLKLLFFTGLNNYRSADLVKDNPAVHAVIGDVPFLNGGLFDKEEYDKISGVTIPDEAVSAILHGLFERHNFTVMESTPLDQEVAVDPEMLGKVFEELVTGRHETGSYYTPRPVVSFMCREALKGYLQGAVASLSAEAIGHFVDQHDVSGLNLASAETVLKALERIKVVDPACGSGAYLLGMMHELVGLETALYSENLLMDTKSLYDLKLRIIEENVYGADIDRFAVNIAMLRLWLSLAIEYESFPPPPLPNLDFKIVCGDSLLGPDPNPDNYGTLFRHRVHDIASQLADLKGRHMKSTSQEKSNLFGEIESLQDELREALTDAAAPEEAVDWRVEFAEVFDQNGGFDVVVANPPYVADESIRQADRHFLRQIYPEVFEGSSDLYVCFFIRGLQILRAGGTHVFVSSNSWLNTSFGEKLQLHLLRNAHPLVVFDSALERQFATANINTVISIIRKTAPLPEHETSFVYLRAPFEQAVAEASKRSTVVRTSAQLRGGLKDVHSPRWSSYLRAPKCYWVVLEKCPHFVPLGTVANVWLGSMTGFNDFFYVRVVSGNPRCDKVVTLENGVGHKFELESDCIIPVVKNLEIANALDQAERGELYCINIGESPSDRAWKYIEWGERLEVIIKQGTRKGDRVVGINNLRFFGGNPRWWQLSSGIDRVADIAVPKMVGNVHKVAWLRPPAMVDQSFYGITSDHTLGLVSSLVNSWWMLAKEVEGRRSMGGGALQLGMADIRRTRILDPAWLEKRIGGELEKAVSAFMNRLWLPVAKEIEKTDRMQLDHLLFEACGLDETDLREVQQGALQLATERENKARSTT